MTPTKLMALWGDQPNDQALAWVAYLEFAATRDGRFDLKGIHPRLAEVAQKIQALRLAVETAVHTTENHNELIAICLATVRKDANEKETSA